MANAYVIVGSRVSPFRPTLEKGDKQTAEFASASAKAVIAGGISVMMGSNPDLDAINKVIECFNRLKKETERELFGEIIEAPVNCKYCGDALPSYGIGGFCSIHCMQEYGLKDS